MGQPLYCSAADAGDAGLWRKRGYGDDSTCNARLSSIALLLWLPGCLAFLHRHFPPRSPPSCPLHTSLHSQQQPSPWDCSTIPKLQLPAATPSKGPADLCRVCMAAARTVCFSFYLGCHRSAASLSALNVSSDSDSCPDVGIRPLLQFPHPPRAGPVLVTLFSSLVPLAYRDFACFYIFFLLIKYSCLLPTGVLHALLCLKVYS